MRTYTALLLIVVLLLAVIAGCPRKAPEGAAGTPPPGAVNQPPENTQTPPEGTTTPPGETTPEGTTPVTPPGQPGATTPGQTTTPPAGQTGSAEKVTKVVLDTTKGRIVLSVHEDWAPVGAKHFLDLVNDKFYDGAPWFRVMEGFVAQVGIAKDPAMNEKWMQQTIPDEAVVQGNKRGMVAFGKSDLPNSRSTHIFINFADNGPDTAQGPGLDSQGFACFAEVTEGMDVADKLARVVFTDQGALAAPGGMEAFKKMFPNADYINKAYVEK